MRRCSRAPNSCREVLGVSGLRMKETAERCAARATIAKALAHPARVRMAEALEDGEKSVRQLTALVGSDQSTISRHLSVLKQAGLVATRKEGTLTYYRLRVHDLRHFWKSIDRVLRESHKTP